MDKLHCNYTINLVLYEVLNSCLRKYKIFLLLHVTQHILVCNLPFLITKRISIQLDQITDVKNKELINFMTLYCIA